MVNILTQTAIQMHYELKGMISRNQGRFNKKKHQINLHKTHTTDIIIIDVGK